MFTENNVSNYFSDNADAWLVDAYEQSGYHYPTPFHRLRVLNKILKEVSGVKKVLDLGCGGGHVALSLAGQGYDVLGIDGSENMIARALDALEKQDLQTKTNAKFKRQSIYELDVQGYDATTAMGVIGYFPSDKTLFDIACKTLVTGGYFIVSFRNKLFDLCSISDYTKRDVENGEFERLCAEFQIKSTEMVPREALIDFIKSLHSITGRILEQGIHESATTERPSKNRNIDYVGRCDPRQSTPDELVSCALNAGFEFVSMHGIHPHIANPHLNKLLPATIFNQLSDSLLSLENTSVSLTWSSVCIGVFKKV